jgi:hypothetical protein
VYKARVGISLKQRKEALLCEEQTTPESLYKRASPRATKRQERVAARLRPLMHWRIQTLKLKENWAQSERKEKIRQLRFMKILSYLTILSLATVVLWKAMRIAIILSTTQICSIPGIVRWMILQVS